ncbi:MAG: patatin-like phospholipase family protein [Actinomycetota bacterium]
MSVAFVLSGGASLGAVEVGMLMALREVGVRPDLIVGTSVGAVNGAWAAGHPDAPIDPLARVWKGLRRRDVFPADPLRGFLSFAGQRRSFVSSGPLRSLVARELTFERLEDAPIPLHVVAADARTGREVCFSEGPALDAIMASAAIPAVFEPVEIDGVPYMDGAIVNNTPISHAVAQGATTVWVLCAGYACEIDEPPRGALAIGLHALSLLLHQQLADDVERFEPIVKLHILPPLCPLDVSPADFSKAGLLIDRAYRQSKEWIAAEHPCLGQREFMGLHDHGGRAGL